MSALTPSGSTRAWRRLRAWILARDLQRCQIPVGTAAETDRVTLPTPGGWCALFGPPGAVICGAWAEHVDHVRPRAAGGSDDEQNLRAACARHNLERGARLEDTPTTTHRRPRAGRWEW